MSKEMPHTFQKYSLEEALIRAAPGSSLYDALRSREFNRLFARFRNPSVEKAYQEYLTSDVLPKERPLAYGFVLLYALFAFLDIMVAGGGALKILTFRLAIIVPVAIAVIRLTHIERFKSYFGVIYTFCIFLAACSVVVMVTWLPTDDPAPYMVGIITVFIFAACILHLPFLEAVVAYGLTAVLYSAITIGITNFSQNYEISGHLFLWTATFLAIGTTYIQGVRSRVFWRESVLREIDEQRIKGLLVEATAADQTKINFLSMMSHELRTPLHQIIGYAEVVKKSFQVANDDDENIPHVEQIHTSANGLLEQIKKMLTYSEATAGRLQYDFEKNEISDVIDAALEKLNSKAAAKNLSINVYGTARATARIDFFHTGYAIANIIENAINASTVNSTITISGRHLEDGKFELVIVDTGAGMSEEQLANVFSAFRQGENHLTRSNEGVGLGLTLARRILSDQGAHLEIESKIGEGTTVVITFHALDVRKLSVET